MTEALIGLAAFCQVFLGCLQAINVVRYHRPLVALTSVLQSVTMLTLYKTVPQVDTWEAALAFTLGGVLGGQVAMRVSYGQRSTIQRDEQKLHG